MIVEQQLRYSKRSYSKIVWLEQSITYSTGRVQVAPVYNLISGVRVMLTARTGAHWTAATLRGGPIYTCLMVPSVHIVIRDISRERAVVRRCRTHHALASCVSPKRPNYCESASLLLKLPTQPDCMLCMEPRILMDNCFQSHMAPTSRDYKLSCFLELPLGSCSTFFFTRHWLVSTKPLFPLLHAAKLDGWWPTHLSSRSLHSRQRSSLRYL